MEEIFEIIGRHVRNTSSEGDEKHLSDWLAQHKGNHSLLEEAQKVWNESANLRNNEQVDLDTAWKIFNQRTVTDEEPPSSRTLPIWKKRLAIAASFLLAILFSYLYINDSGIELKLTATADVRTSMELPDGSLIWLNKDAQANYSEMNNMRLLELTGEAFFDVARDPSRPFVISTGRMKTEVIGTSFNIDFHPNEDIVVSVASGKVKVSDSNDKTILLTKGQSSSYDQSISSLIKQDRQDPNYLSWKTGVLTFENNQIDYVIKILNEYYGSTLSVVPGNNETQTRLTARFDNQELIEVLEMISITTDVELIANDN